MKKIIPIILVGFFLLSSYGVNGILIQSDTSFNEILKKTVEGNSKRGTHSVLGEFGTTTWCSACKYAHGALKELYAEQQLDFFYVTYVCDINSVGYSYCVNHYNLYGYPTLWWDGGYKVDLGAGSVPVTKSMYNTSINQCLVRTVEDVEVTLEVSWLGGTNMEIDCTVTNNEGSTYGGIIRVFICEKVSSMGWYDSGGQLYTMPFLDFAFDETLSIPSGGSWTDSTTWDGTSHGYSSITKDNTIVIAAVYNDEWHQGYSYPPSGNPFSAYYVDECVAVDLGAGTKPDKPTITGPATGIVGFTYNYTVSTTDPDGDDLFYNVDWDDATTSGWIGPFPSGDDAIIQNIWENPGTYNVKVQAKDDKGLISDWSDPITVTIENNAPEAPTIEGENSGTSGTAYIYVFNSFDANNDNVYYYIEWGDGEFEEWVGPYNSGQNHNETHTFQTTGTFTIRAKAKDIYGSESGWTTLDVTMPRNRVVNNPFFNRLLEQFPLLNLLLHRLRNKH